MTRYLVGSTERLNGT